MEFRILGPLVVSHDGEPLPLGGPKQRAVLAHLILRANRVVSADLLIDGLWGDAPPESARNTLQTYVYRLRKTLGDGRVEGRDGGYVLDAAADEIDAARFEVLVRQGKAALADDPARAAGILADALSLWRADALADLAEEPSLRGEAARLEELRLSATEHRIAAEIAAGGHSTVVSELESLTSRYPLRERMWAHLMLALYRSARQAEALSTYERARGVLADELGADPSPELERLHERILRRDPSLGHPEPARAAVRPSRIDLPPGTEFAGYRIERTLGRGGMSVVYLAEHEWLQRKVALKVLAPQLAQDERFRERFVRESRLAASLDHPNVIPIYEAGASGGDLFIAMRYVEGTDLRTLLHEGGAPEPARAIAIVRQVAAALDAAHEQGLVHRDVKPANVLLARARGSEAGEHVYLSDFGLTKRSASDSGITGTGQFVGTLDYAAPEQFKGGTPDARTDVYSLGCVLFECLTGRPPFQAENDAGLMYAHLQEPPPAVTAERPELPAALDGVIATAMAKSADARQRSASALVDEASRALHVGPPNAPDGKQPRSHLGRLVPVVAVAIALGVGIIASSLLRGGEPVAGTTSPGTRTTAPRPSPSPTFRTVDRALSQDEQRLLASIPPDVGSDCLPLDRAEPIQDELAALVCTTADVEVLYELFPTQSDMNAAFQQGVNSRQAPDGECATDHRAVTTYSIDGELAGRVLCYTIEHDPDSFGVLQVQPDESHIEWTDENSSIYAHAVRHDLGDLTLYEWWLLTAGPVEPGAEGVVEKDRPTTAAGGPPRDGAYLVLPRKGCAGFDGATCGMKIEAGTYQLIFAGDSSPVETGDLVIRKPKTMVFAPRNGYCFQGREGGEIRSTKAASYGWSETADTLILRRTGGGSCAGPGKLTHGPWIRAPGGVLAVETGGDIGLVDTAGFLTTKLFNPETRPNSFPAWSPDGSRIVFSGASQGGFDLYVMDDDGTHVTPIADVPGDEYAPDWSPDGSSIAYAFDDLSDPWRSGIKVVRPDGSGATEVLARTEERVENPAWAPDGERIALTVWEGPEPGIPYPYVVNDDGTEMTKLTKEPGVVLDWTPDGSRILLSQGGSFVSVRPDGSAARMFLAHPPDGGRLVLDWSPDGGWVVMSAPTAAGDGMYLMRAGGGQVFFLGPGREAAWRPEGP